MRFAYADPPYIGQAKKHYSDDPQAAEVDHDLLIAQLERKYDGWALSLSAPSLGIVLALCGEHGLYLEDQTIRLGMWAKPFCSFKKGIGQAYAFEPVIFRNIRKRTRNQPTVRDYVSTPITLKRGVHGAKPEAFCFWLFEFANLQPGDTLIDLYPGSGAVSQAWHRWRRQLWTA